jgi:hypothetical protein
MQVNTNVRETQTRPAQFKHSRALVFGRNDDGRTGVWICCDTCPERDFSAFPPQVHPLAIQQRWTRRKWEVVDCGRQGTCPKCLEKRKAARRAPKVHTPAPPPRPVLPPHLTVNLSSTAAAHGLRAMHELLDARPRHVPTPDGGTDEAIAAKTGLDPRVVAYYRASLTGPLVHPRILELEAALGRLEEKLETELAAIRATLETLPAGPDQEAVRALAENLAAEVRGNVDILDAEGKRHARATADDRLAPDEPHA